MSCSTNLMVPVFLFSLALLELVSASPMSLTLERAFPTNHGIELSQLRVRDMQRHANIVNFPVHGTSDPAITGLYYTKVQLGSPPREFNVLIDTGSDITWVSYGSCNGCPLISGFPIQLNYFDPWSSSTSSLISCSDQRCRNGLQSKEAICSIHNNQCSYTIQYQDDSGTSGYYVSDLMQFASTLEGSRTTNFSVPVVFGCSNVRTGSLTSSEKALDGIFGFGQLGMSVLSQFYSQGIAPRVFSHCLKGDSNGGGILVLGEIVEPNIVYSPLVPSQTHYNLNLQSISVNGHKLRIDPAVFTKSSNRGAIIDSGTTLAYLAEEAYDPFVDALNGAVWCLGFQKVQDITILGDLVLKDKIFVYDLAGQRLGWADYDCSLPVNVSASTGKGRSENTGKPSGSASVRDRPHKVTKIGLLAFLVHITLILI